MHIRGLHRTIVSLLPAAALLLAACQPAAVATTLVAPTFTPPQPTYTAPPAAEMVTQTARPTYTAMPVMMATQTPAQPASTMPASGGNATLSLDLGDIAQSQTVETVPAVAESGGGPWWDVAPQHQVITLRGYPVSNHLMKPQIFIYPAAELGQFNPAAGKIAADLQSQLQSQAAADRLPFLPMYNAGQVMHPQVKFLDFKTGKGVRFLTQFDQAPLPVNNFELIYTYQGLTSDGKYYVAAVLPVTHPDLPATVQVSPQQAAELNDFSAYLSKTVTWLDKQPPSAFTPDLSKLDALVQSIEVR